MNKKTRLTTGEFAKLCKTTKETLFHYDRENLLKPKYVSENGYRYYSADQFFEFDLISVLKETGSSLREIGVIVRDTDGRRFLKLLEEKKAFFKKENERLAQREIMLHDMIAGTHEALGSDYDVFKVGHYPEERLEVLPTAPSPLEPSAQFAERFAEYIAFYGQQGRVPSYPFGVILLRADMEKGDYLEKFLFSRASRFTPPALLQVKPEGKYAVLAHRGTVQSHLLAFGEMLKQIAASGLKFAGNAYVYDMMSSVLLASGEVHASKYCIRVE